MHKVDLSDLMTAAQLSSRAQSRKAWYRRNYLEKEDLLEEALREYRHRLWVGIEPANRRLLRIVGPNGYVGGYIVLHIPIWIARKRRWFKLIGEMNREMMPA